MLSADKGGTARAAELLRAGGLVAMPTETVYGLAGDASNDSAIAAIFEAKGRPSFNPLIIHFPDAESAWAHVQPTPAAEQLARAFWPGALTLVLPRRASSNVSLLASAGLDTLAVRVPAHALAHDFLMACGRPVAAPSANRSGSISPTHPEHVAQSLGDGVDAILDGGPCDIGIESTVIGFSGARCIVLRPGGISAEDIEAVVGPLSLPLNDSEISSPGMLLRHYAPDSPIQLNADHAAPGAVMLGFGPDMPHDAPPGSLNLSAGGNLREAAANLFAMLRALDALGRDGICVMPIPQSGLGVAINDRLCRAATPEDT